MHTCHQWALCLDFLHPFQFCRFFLWGNCTFRQAQGVVCFQQGGVNKVCLDGISLAPIFSKATQRPFLHLGMHDLRNELFSTERADKIGIDIWVAAVFSMWTLQFHDPLYLPKRMAINDRNMVVLYIVAGYHSRVVGNAFV